MRIRIATLTALGALVASAGGLRAQEATPGFMVVRYFECGLGDLGEAVELLNGSWRGLVQGLVDEDRLVDYGILTHAWGDEWNLVDYYTATDATVFQESWRELLLRLQATDPDGELFERFAALCPRHKDNMYSVVPPS